jgi:hypothetical protein
MDNCGDVVDLMDTLAVKPVRGVEWKRQISLAVVASEVKRLPREAEGGRRDR